MDYEYIHKKAEANAPALFDTPDLSKLGQQL